MNKYYVYRHIRLDDNTPFYVGKGKCKRAYSIRQRNRYWQSIVAKCDYEVEIIMEDLTEEQAFEKEIEFIKLYKDLGYCEANMTDGGDGGLSGFRHTKESKIKMSQAVIDSYENSETRRRRMSEATAGSNNPMYGKVTWMKGKKHTEEAKKRNSEAHIGKKITAATRELLSKASIGSNNPRAKKVICTETGQIWDCAKYAALEKGLNISTLRGWLNPNSPRKNNTTLKYLL